MTKLAVRLNNMKQNSLDYYRQLAETDPDIAVLIETIDRLQDELTVALTEAIRP